MPLTNPETAAEQAVDNICLTLQLRGFSHQARWLREDCLQSVFCDGHLVIWIKGHWTANLLTGKKTGQEILDAARCVSGAKSVVIARAVKSTDRRSVKQMKKEQT